MTSREGIEDRIIADHIALRGLIGRVQSVAGQIARGERRLVGALRVEVEALYEALRAHNAWENKALAPRLRDAGDLGRQRAVYLEEDHGTQLEIVGRAVQDLRTQSLPAESLAREMLNLTDQLIEDLSDEEEMVLDEKLWGSAPREARA